MGFFAGVVFGILVAVTIFYTSAIILDKPIFHCTNYDYTADTCVQYSRRDK